MSSQDQSAYEGAPFVMKTYQILADTQSSKLISWSEDGGSFIVWNPVDFSSQVLPRYFKHSNFCSFIRQLNTYGFLKVDSKNWEFKHELFQRGKPELLKQIIRRKSKKRNANGEEEGIEVLSQTTSPPMSMGTYPVTSTPSSIQSPYVPLDPSVQHIVPPVFPQQVMGDVTNLCVAPSSIEKLKEINHLLTKEVIRLQQQQEATNSTLIHIMAEMAELKKEIQHIDEKFSRGVSLNDQQQIDIMNSSSPYAVQNKRNGHTPQLQQRHTIIQSPTQSRRQSTSTQQQQQQQQHLHHSLVQHQQPQLVENGGMDALTNALQNDASIPELEKLLKMQLPQEDQQSWEDF